MRGPRPVTLTQALNALQAVILDAEDAEMDRNPETGVVYATHKAARKVLDRAIRANQLKRTWVRP